jgi:hypothetical protein
MKHCFRPRWIGSLVWVCFILTAFSPPAQVLITEFLSNNTRSIKDEDGDYVDWIEIGNFTIAAVDLEGWFLTDDAADLKKWRFPKVVLDPNRQLVVYASNKNRAVAGRPLHTNFRLSNEGEYLALVQPDGTNIVSEFRPRFPQQAPDVSFGFPMAQENEVLIPMGVAGRMLVPETDLLGASWTQASFDDAFWDVLTTPIGFELPAPEPKMELLADSVEDFSGIQGERQWFYGYYNKSLDRIINYQVVDFVAFPRDDGPPSASNFWTGESWDWFNGNPPWDQIRRETMHPSGVNTGEEHWAIRRWVSRAAGTLQVEWTLAKVNALGKGVTGRVYQNGVQRDILTIGGTQIAPTTRTVLLQGVKVGDFIDFALSPIGLSNATDDTSDESYFTVKIFGATTLTNDIATDIAPRMHQRNASVYARFPFNVEDASAFEFLTLRLKFNDGFVAWLNGVQVAARNAPELVNWNSTAAATRQKADSVRFEEFNLSGALGLVHVGTNVLAIQGLNAAADDSDFLLAPELVATTFQLTEGLGVYFYPPTPGAFNGSGNTNFGPLVFEIRHAPSQPSDDDALHVTARVTRTFHPVGTLSLVYRVMYGPETNVTMTDDGQNGDGTAGDGIFGATIPASAAAPGQMLRYYISATDTAGNRTRWPQYFDTRNSPQYFGTVVANPAVTSSLPILEWFIEFPSRADNDTGTRCSLFYLGEFYDNVGVKLHGQSTTSFPKRSYDFDFHLGYNFRYAPNQARVDDFNLISTYADKAHMRNILA